MTASVWNAQSERRWSRPGLPPLRRAERRLAALGYVCAARAPDELVFIGDDPRHFLRVAAGGAGKELTFFPWAFGAPLPPEPWLAERAELIFSLLD